MFDPFPLSYPQLYLTSVYIKLDFRIPSVIRATDSHNLLDHRQRTRVSHNPEDPVEITEAKAEIILGWAPHPLSVEAAVASRRPNRASSLPILSLRGNCGL